MEIMIFARVYLNLELLNEEFVTYLAMVKVLATWRSPCAKGCYLMQKLEPLIGRVYLPKCFGINFFLLQFDL